MKINKRLEAILDVLLLLALFWAVRYWYSRHFGLYEDDLTIIPDAFQRSFSSLIGYIFIYITHFYGHARPLSDSSIYFFSWVGWHIAGLWGPYLLGYLITAINIGLFYWLMRRTAGRPFALIAGLGYILYSADTTQAFLTHSLGVQPSVLLILLAMHAYLSNKRILAYVLAFVVLFSYELPFLLLVAAPLLKKKWDKALWKEMLWHTGILVVMLAAIYLFRTAIGEGRVSGLGLKDLVTTPFVHSLEGPFVSLGTFAYRPLQAIRGLNLEVGIAVLLAFGLFLWILSRLEVPTQVKLRDLWRAVRDPVTRHALPEEVRALGRFFVVGAVMLVMAYPLTFTVRAYALSGRDTRVHLAGVAGAAVLVAAVTFLFIYLTNGSRWRKVINVLIAMELALLAGYGFIIQRDYVLAWQYQREFWTELLPLIPDAGEGTVILVDPAALHDTRQIGANYWNLPRVLMQLYTYPEDMKALPVVHRLEKGWQSTLLAADGRIQVNAVTVYSVPDYYGEFDPQQVILIQAENGRLVRRESVTLNGKIVSLKPTSALAVPPLPHAFLYHLMIGQP
ncbi:MAG: hypothetical protein ABSB41_06365 [Anaerolineales bacterium]|jgi:hypothetical protein